MLIGCPIFFLLLLSAYERGVLLPSIKLEFLVETNFILAGAVALPNLYWLAFEKPMSYPFILYSSAEHDFFMIRREGESVRTDRKGNIYTRDEFEQKLPMFFARQLVISGTMPDSINGRAMDTSLRAVRQALSILYGQIEKQSG